jgi:hypothetical protein
MKSSVSIAKRTPNRTATAFASLGLSLVVALTGCSGDGTTFGDTNGAPTTGVYVIQNTPPPASSSIAKATSPAATTGTILQFSTSASGASTPVSTIANLNVTSLAYLAVDGTGDIYTTAAEGTTGSSVLEFPVNSSNNAQPTRSIPFNTTTQITAPNALAVDAAGDLALPEANSGVAIFSSTANGSVAPSAYITGGGSTLVNPTAAAVDTNDNLYIVNSGEGVGNPIVVFNTTSTGAPIRSIGGALTTMAVGSPQAIATDSAGNLYVANVVSGVSSILVFEPTATGNTPPLRDITGSNTLLGCVGGIALDNAGYLYVVSVPTCGSTASPTVLKFSTTGDGNIAPVATFTSPAWTNADPTLSIAVYGATQPSAQ